MVLGGVIFHLVTLVLGEELVTDRFGQAVQWLELVNSFRLDYHESALDGEWFHGTFQGKELCDLWSLM